MAMEGELARRLLTALDEGDDPTLDALVDPDAVFLVGGDGPRAGYHRGSAGLLELWRGWHWRLTGVNFPPSGGVDFIVEKIETSEGSATIFGFLQREVDPVLEPTLVALTVSFSGTAVAGGWFLWNDQAAVDAFALRLAPAEPGPASS